MSIRLVGLSVFHILKSNGCFVEYRSLFFFKLIFLFINFKLTVNSMSLWENELFFIYCRLENIEENAHSYFSKGDIQASPDVRRYLEVSCLLSSTKLYLHLLACGFLIYFKDSPRAYAYFLFPSLCRLLMRWLSFAGRGKRVRNH